MVRRRCCYKCRALYNHALGVKGKLHLLFACQVAFADLRQRHSFRAVSVAATVITAIAAITVVATSGCCCASHDFTGFQVLEVAVPDTAAD